MTADELDTAAIRAGTHRLCELRYHDRDVHLPCEPCGTILKLCAEVDRLRAAGGVQPAPDPNVACSWCQQPIGGTDHFSELIHFPCYDERAEAEEAEPSAAGSTDGAGTPQPAEFIYPGGGLAFTELKPAGPRDWNREPTVGELGLSDPPQLGPDDYPEDHPGRDPHCGIVHPHSRTSRCAGD